jgi:hypothetical protein
MNTNKKITRDWQETHETISFDARALCWRTHAHDRNDSRNRVSFYWQIRNSSSEDENDDTDRFSCDEHLGKLLCQHSQQLVTKTRTNPIQHDACVRSGSSHENDTRASNLFDVHSAIVFGRLSRRNGQMNRRINVDRQLVPHTFNIVFTCSTTNECCPLDTVRNSCHLFIVSCRHFDGFFLFDE